MLKLFEYFAFYWVGITKENEKDLVNSRSERFHREFLHAQEKIPAVQASLMLLDATW